MFATARGYVRRNALSDFVEVRQTGKIAMKFEGDDADDQLIGVAVCTDGHDVLLATRSGKCIRFPAPAVRVFAGRGSVGVRGIKLADGDRVISMSILRHEEIEPATRDAYLAMAREQRRAMGEESEAAAETPEPDAAEPEAEADEGASVAERPVLSREEFAALAAREEFVLSVTEKGFGVRASAFEYRITNRGGSGIGNMDLTRRQDAVVAVFPVGHDDQIMLVTDGGMVIRVPVDGIRIARRRTAGVVVFKVAEGERVVSVARLGDTGDENGGNGEAVSEGG
jgi:DNA gyrase subunit A